MGVRLRGSVKKILKRLTHSKGSVGLRLVLVWLLILLTSSLALVHAERRERERLSEAGRSDILHLVDLLSREDEQLLERGRILLKLLASVPEIAAGDSTTCNAYLWRTLDRQPEFFTFGVANLEGEVICSAHQEGLSVEIGDRPYFREAIEARDFIVGSYRRDRTTGRATIHFAQPILDEQGQVRRVLFSALNLKWLDGFAERVQLPEGSQILAWDTEGNILAGYPEPEEWMGRNLSTEDFIQQSLLQDRGTAVLTEPDGSELILAYTGIAPRGMRPSLRLAVGVPREEIAAASAQSLRTHLFILWGTGAAGALLLLLTVYVWLLWPLRRMEAAAIALASGQLETRSAILTASNEVTRLSASFDAMAAALEESILNREEFIGLAAHELKTPLTTLKLHLQNVLSRLDQARAMNPAQLKLSLAAAERQIWRLTQLVETILDARTLSGPTVPVQPSRCDLAEVVRSVCHRLAPSFEANGTHLVLQLEQPLEGVWDSTLVERLLGQLLSNALKFGQRRPVVVSLAREHGEAVLGVQDFGVGVDPADQARIFERFERAVSSRHHGGLGLGLWVAREIAHKLGGEIELHSERGLGATFQIRLPLDITPHLHAQELPRASSATEENTPV